MRTDDDSASLDRFEDDGDEAELLGIDGGEAEPLERPDDPDADPDEALLEAELGAHDGAVTDDFDLDDDLEDESADDEECDDRELALLQELGIDLDVADGPIDALDLPLGDEGSAVDDEVAA